MKIGITLDDVLRDFSSQFVYVVSKYRNTRIMAAYTRQGDEMDNYGNLLPSDMENAELMDELRNPEFDEKTYNSSDSFKIDLEKTPLDTYDLFEFLGRYPEIVNFQSIDDLNLFLYGKAALEIFGHADLKEGVNHRDNIMVRFNKFLIEMVDEEEHEIQLVSREAMNSIPATYFFLAKTLCRVSDIRFVTKYEQKWDDVDILITASPRALKAKPEGKISVKINTPYNTDVEADYELDSLVPFLENEELRNAIIEGREIMKEENKEE